MLREANGHERTALSQGYCPHCGDTHWLLGPKGGLCQNYQCNTCDLRVNVMLYDGKLLHAEILSTPVGYKIASDKPTSTLRKDTLGFVLGVVLITSLVVWWLLIKHN